MTTKPTTTRGCALDTDGDGNCHAHPKGCPGPSESRETARAIAEHVADAYRCDVVTGLAPGVTLADLIEVSLEEAIAAEQEACAALAKLAVTDLDSVCPFPGRKCAECEHCGAHDMGDGGCIAAAIRARKDGVR